ncbi:hypothetical protein C0J52_02987 [Blattella germanica]|nr:hypothetical protein C0J52_02987 [Blattella germanica]
MRSWPRFCNEDRLSIINIVELILIAGRHMAAPTSPKQATVYGTVLGFSMICIISIIGIVTSRPLSRFIMLLVNFSGGLLYMVSGGIMIETYVDLDYGRVLGAGIVGLLLGIVYFIDFAVTFFSSDDES